ncbi:MAG TPA: diaminopimelate epimerase [Acidimicrobiales bacterium]|nr:diaminopimelate epimerase [Acidimicrobiales bacterium]
MTAPASPAPPLDLVKLEGAGNDFLVLLDPAPAAPGVAGAPDLADLARLACERHRGFGADGLVRGTRPGDGADLGFELWNADGSTAEMSGNGMRCLAHAALDAGWVAEGAPFSVSTAAGRRQVTIRRSADGSSAWSGVAMGRPTVSGAGDRCNVGHGSLRVDMGNPHLVVAGPDPATVDVGRLGPQLEASVPGGCNVEFVTLGPGPDELTMRVWERGVGETLACGTGSCAAAVAFATWGRVGRAVTVHQPGGSVAVEWAADDTVVLSGPSRRIGTCRWGAS